MAPENATAMDPARWARVRAVFEEAVECDAAERGALLEAVGAQDPALRRAVEQLLAADAGAGAFLQDSPFHATAETLSSAAPGAPILPPEPLRGRRIGAYVLAEEIGHGGMGAVYRAVRADGHYEQEVAIKLIAQGLETRAALERFRFERQILARLEHPGIARLLDGGSTEDGLPYLVMEYVRGERIDRWCDRQALSLRDRLALFLKVCEAVEHAHRALVIHRDIKPANILVDADGTPRLLDFGIARLVTPEPDAQATATALRAFTPEYASPEQVRGQAMTTASDVYSLGVVLYELLTGRSPYGASAREPSDLVRAITEQEPARPSTVMNAARALRGDLDTIVMTALRKEPARRYGSVAQLAADVRACLEGRPVSARPDTFAYRAQKWVRRNVALSAALAAAAVAVAAGLVLTTWQARVARAERARAERRFADVRRLANRFLFEFHDEVARLPGSTRARRRMVTTALEYLDRLTSEAPEPALQRELALAYQRVGDVQGWPGQSHLGDYAGAEGSYRKAIAIQEALAARVPDDAAVRVELMRSYNRLGMVVHARGDAAGALAAYGRAEGLASGGEPALALEASATQAGLGDARLRAGDVAGAMASLRRAVALADSAHPEDAPGLTVVARALQGLARAMAKAGEFEAALEQSAAGISIRETLAAGDDADTRTRYELAVAYADAGTILHRWDEHEAALEVYARALPILEGLAARDPFDADALRQAARTHLFSCETLRQMKRLDAAEKECRLGADYSERLMRLDPAAERARLDAALARLALGDVLSVSNRWDESVAAYQAAAQAASSEGAEARRHRAHILGNMGNVLLKKGDFIAAGERLRQALAIQEPLVAAAPESVEARLDLADFHYRMGEVSEGRARTAAAAERGALRGAARDSFTRSLALYRALSAGGIPGLERDVKQAEEAAARNAPATARR